MHRGTYSLALLMNTAEIINSVFELLFLDNNCQSTDGFPCLVPWLTVIVWWLQKVVWFLQEELGYLSVGSWLFFPKHEMTFHFFSLHAI